MVRSLILALCVTVGGCAAAAPSVIEVPAVRQLTRSDNHVVRQPVHATTDMTHGGAKVEGEAEGDAVVTRKDDASQLPDIAPKRFGF